MIDRAVDLDRHHGMAEEKATALRRLPADVEAHENVLRFRQDELQSHMLAAPAADWHEAAEMTRYQISIVRAGL